MTRESNTSNSDRECGDPSPCAISSHRRVGKCATLISFDANASAITSGGSQPVEPSIEEAEHLVQHEKGRKWVSRSKTWAGKVTKTKKKILLCPTKTFCKKTSNKKTVIVRSVPLAAATSIFPRWGMRRLMRSSGNTCQCRQHTSKRNIRRKPLARKQSTAEQIKKWILSYCVTYKGKEVTLQGCLFLYKCNNSYEDPSCNGKII